MDHALSIFSRPFAYAQYIKSYPHIPATSGITTSLTKI